MLQPTIWSSCGSIIPPADDHIIGWSTLTLYNWCLIDINDFVSEWSFLFTILKMCLKWNLWWKRLNLGNVYHHLDQTLFSTQLLSKKQDYANWPDIIVGSTNSTQEILRLMVTGNVYQLGKKNCGYITTSYQLFYLAARTKSVVSRTARRFYQNTSLLSSQSFLSTCSHKSLSGIVSELSLG